MYAKIVSDLLKAVPKRYAHIDFVPPKGVREEAERGLRLRREHGRGGLSNKQASKHGIGSGVQRASDLASGDKMSPRSVKRMRAFFARHSAYKEHHRDKTSPAYISWLLWGGDAGERWANKIVAQMERADDQMKKGREGSEKPGHLWESRRRVVRSGRLGYVYKYADEKQRRAAARGKSKDKRKQKRAVTSPPALPIPDNLASDWTPAGVAQSVADNPTLHTPTFEAISTAPMGEFGSTEAVSEEVRRQYEELVAAKTRDTEDITSRYQDIVAATPLSTSLSDALKRTVQVEEPTEEAATGETPADEEPSSEEPSAEESSTEEQAAEEPTESAPEEAPAKEETEAEGGREVLLPIKPVGRATALTLLQLATETYKVLNTGNPDALGMESLDSWSKKEMNKVDADARQEAREKLRESLNKDREDARAKAKETKDQERAEKEETRTKEREAKEQTRKEEQARKEKLGQEAFERELQFRRGERELKEQRQDEQRAKKEAQKEEAAKKKEEKIEARKEKAAERKEAAKEKAAERKEKQRTVREEQAEKRREKAAERKEKQRAASAERREKQKTAAEERREKAKERDQARRKEIAELRAQLRDAKRAPKRVSKKQPKKKAQ